MSVLLSRPGSVADPASTLAWSARFDDSLHVVELSGELDLATRATVRRACVSPGHLNVLVDLAGLTFMDCAGYQALVDATAILDGRGGSLVMMNPVGAARRLLTLMEELELGLCAPVRYGNLDAWHATPVLL